MKYQRIETDIQPDGLIRVVFVRKGATPVDPSLIGNIIIGQYIIEADEPNILTA